MGFTKEGVGTISGKLWLLKYSTHLRVCITSANMKEMDWSVTLNMSQFNMSRE
jgi:hypothetical protein